MAASAGPETRPAMMAAPIAEAIASRPIACVHLMALLLPLSVAPPSSGPRFSGSSPSCNGRVTDSRDWSAATFDEHLGVTLDRDGRGVFVLIVGGVDLGRGASKQTRIQPEPCQIGRGSATSTPAREPSETSPTATTPTSAGRSSARRPVAQKCKHWSQ